VRAAGYVETITKRPGKLFKHDGQKAAIAYSTKCGTLARA